MRGYGSLQKEFQFFVLKRFSWFSPMQYLTKKSKLSKVFDILGIISASLDMVCKESWEKAFYFCWRVQMRVRRYAMHVIYSWCCFIENYNNARCTNSVQNPQKIVSKTSLNPTCLTISDWEPLLGSLKSAMHK